VRAASAGASGACATSGPGRRVLRTNARLPWRRARCWRAGGRELPLRGERHGDGAHAQCGRAVGGGARGGCARAAAPELHAIAPGPRTRARADPLDDARGRALAAGRRERGMQDHLDECDRCSAALCFFVAMGRGRSDRTGCGAVAAVGIVREWLFERRGRAHGRRGLGGSARPRADRGTRVAGAGRDGAGVVAGASWAWPPRWPPAPNPFSHGARGGSSADARRRGWPRSPSPAVAALTSAPAPRRRGGPSSGQGADAHTQRYGGNRPLRAQPPPRWLRAARRPVVQGGRPRPGHGTGAGAPPLAERPTNAPSQRAPAGSVVPAGAEPAASARLDRSAVDTTPPLFHWPAA